jgi:TRAP-type mannitol/chloroaromatic compound transport system substrate-binding protein
MMNLRLLVRALLVCGLLLSSRSSHAVDIAYRSFSSSATMGPQAAEFANKLAALTTVALGSTNRVRFVALSGTPAIPPQFGGQILGAVAAGATGGGFDAAYISGTDLNKAWGFVFNSGVPFGPNFDEFIGFLYGKIINGTSTGLDLVQWMLDAHQSNVVVLPIVASSEQLSGYFPLPIGDNEGHHRGIGLAGLCQQSWTLRYLPPAEYAIDKACDNLVAAHAIASKNIRFIEAVPGAGSLIGAVKSGQLQGFEFATPLDDVSQLWVGADNPGTVGIRFVHAPGWQQQFLITWMVVNKDVWNGLSPGQQAIAMSVARDHVLSSYSESMQQQGDALRHILSPNHGGRDDQMVLSEWPERDLERLSAATNQILNERTLDPSLPSEDRQELATVLELLRAYVHSNNRYWNLRGIRPQMRFEHWRGPTGQPWADERQGRR